MPGRLFIVATPIGNLADVSERALTTLREVKLIACEDTRHTRVLLDKFGVATPVTSLPAFAEGQRAGAILERLLAGERLADFAHQESLLRAPSLLGGELLDALAGPHLRGHLRYASQGIENRISDGATADAVDRPQVATKSGVGRCQRELEDAAIGEHTFQACAIARKARQLAYRNLERLCGRERSGGQPAEWLRSSLPWGLGIGVVDKAGPRGGI